MPGMLLRKLRSMAGTAPDGRLIDVPLSPPVASESAKTVPPRASALMANPTITTSAFMRRWKNAMMTPMIAPAPIPASTPTYQGA